MFGEIVDETNGDTRANCSPSEHSLTHSSAGDSVWEPPGGGRVTEGVGEGFIVPPECFKREWMCWRQERGGGFSKGTLRGLEVVSILSQVAKCLLSFYFSLFFPPPHSLLRLCLLQRPLVLVCVRDEMLLVLSLSLSLSLSSGLLATISCCRAAK